MFGRVEKGPLNTRFQLFYELHNGVVIHRSFMVSNLDLDERPQGYGLILDALTEAIEKNLAERE